MKSDFELFYLYLRILEVILICIIASQLSKIKDVSLTKKLFSSVLHVSMQCKRNFVYINVYELSANWISGPSGNQWDILWSKWNPGQVGKWIMHISAPPKTFDVDLIAPQETSWEILTHGLTGPMKFIRLGYWTCLGKTSRTLEH